MRAGSRPTRRPTSWLGHVVTEARAPSIFITLSRTWRIVASGTATCGACSRLSRTGSRPFQRPCERSMPHLERMRPAVAEVFYEPGAPLA